MRRLGLNGTEIAYLDAGEGDSVLLLHGLGASRDDWRRQVGEFSARYRVIAPDLRGFGHSERREPFTIAQHARDMEALIAELDIAPAHVVGLSMGGAVAIELAVRKPALVASLVLANTAPAFTLTSWQRRRMAWLRVLLALVLGVGGVARLFAKRAFPGRRHRRVRRRFMQRASHTSRWVYLATLRALVRWNAEERLEALSMPVLVLGAEHDYTTSEEKRRWVARIPDARFVEIPRSRHHSQLDSPRRFNAEVLSFLSRQSARVKPGFR